VGFELTTIVVIATDYVGSYIYGCVEGWVGCKVMIKTPELDRESLWVTASATLPLR
jgi:hypothetical protein